LDARTSLEIEQHLKSCPECARLFAEAEKLEDRIKGGLKQGERTAALWDRIERSVADAGASTTRHRRSPGDSQPAGSHALIAALGEELQGGWRRARWAWSGLAAAWVVILALNFTAREAEPPLMAGNRPPPASEVRFAVKQKQLLMAELAFISESAPAAKPKAAPTSPRSDRRSTILYS